MNLYSLIKAYNTATAPDEVHYQFLNLPKISLQYLIEIYNIWIRYNIPFLWKKSYHNPHSQKSKWFRKTHKLQTLLAAFAKPFLYHMYAISISVCNKAVQLLKVVAHTTWRADKTRQLNPYRTLWSKLDYRNFIYGLVRKSYLKTIKTIHHPNLRQPLEAFTILLVNTLKYGRHPYH